MNDPYKILMQVSGVLSSIRNSLDRITRSEAAAFLTIGEVAEIAGQIEELRFPISSLSRTSIASTDIESLISRIEFTGRGLASLIANEKYRAIASSFRFRPLMTPRAPLTGGLFDEFPTLIRGNLNVYQATEILHDILTRISSVKYIESLFQEDKVKDSQLSSRELSKASISNLKRIVPQQKIAPIQFKIENNKIAIDRKPSVANKRDTSNIDAAKQKIAKDGNDIIEKLKQSNCDKRLIENLEILQNSILANENAVQIGMNNISFGVMSAVYKNELPDALNANLQAHSLNVNMFIAQFPDWARFSENALAVETTEDDIVAVKSSVTSIIEHLEEDAEIAEPAVLRAFKQLGSLLNNPSQASKRAAFAVIRTAENLFSKIFHHTILFFEDIIKDSANDIKKVVSKTITGSLVALAINGATELTDLSAKINELSWLKNAIEIVEKQMKIYSNK
ncbi:hypothetical protein [Methylobacterium sp. 77]|uniref:hypothetical protein n=1 Tax=Methylobacterium sp. 77 TaxID=1101192 RepID=UPI0003A7FE57|nr:hypothetical protein [Methylobacterium sp. 77]